MPPRNAARSVLRTFSSLTPLFFVAPIWAQDPPPVPLPEGVTVTGRIGVVRNQGQQPTNGPKPVRNLKDGLEQTAWNADTRGPLLALAPENISQKMPEREPDDWYTPYKPPVPLGPPANPRGYRLEEIAPYFGRKIVRCGSLTVLAADEMIVLNVPKTPANPFADLRRDEKMTLLQATLSTAQWRMLASPNGLGLNDLTREQKDLFLAILPNPMRVIRMAPLPDGQGSRVDYPVPGQDPRITLTEAQRQGARLRINRQINMTIPAAGPEGTFNYGTGVWQRPQGNRPYFSLTAPNEWQKKTLFGERIREKVPTKLKIGQIDFDAEGLNARVSLADAKTVGDLTKRVSDATRQEIYADKRVADLKIWVNGSESSVRAGDLLKALAWAVTGAYRRVGTAFVLTHDVAGIAQIRGRIAEWSQQAESSLQKTFQEARKNVSSAGALQYMTFAADDPLTPPADMAQRVESSWKKQEQRSWGEQFRMSELPPTYQVLAKQAIEQYNRDQGQRASARPILTDRVNVNVTTKMTLVIPEVGEVAADFGGGGATSFLPPLPPGENRSEAMRTDPVKLPDTMAAGGTVCIAPTTPDEAKKAVALAAERHLRQVWVLLPVEPSEGKETLAAAIAAGKVAKIPVCAVVRLMIANPMPDGPPPGSPDSDRDINLYGESGSQYAARRRATPINSLNFNPFGNTVPAGDWLRPDAPTTLAIVQRRVKDIAKTPGLAGVVLIDVAAPGYNTKTQTGFLPMDGGSEFGYTLERRFAILRGESLDPVDVTNGQGFNSRGTDMSLPFFPDITRPWKETGTGEVRPDESVVTPGMKWSQFRFDLTRNVLTAVYKAIRAEQPNMPIYLRELNAGIWVGPWDKPDVLPILGDATSTADFARMVQESTKTPLFYLKATPSLIDIGGIMGTGAETLTLPQAFSRYTRMIAFPQGALGGMPFKVDGVVFDVTEFPFEEGLKLMREAVAEQAAPATIADSRGK